MYAITAHLVSSTHVEITHVSGVSLASSPIGQTLGFRNRISGYGLRPALHPLGARRTEEERRSVRVRVRVHVHVHMCV